MTQYNHEVKKIWSDKTNGDFGEYSKKKTICKSYRPLQISRKEKPNKYTVEANILIHLHLRNFI